jgi:HTH-type transcriptional regulator/antitoxin HipB
MTDDRRKKPVPIGLKIRRLRLARGLTQAALARRARVRQATISDLERGLVNRSVDVLNRIARVLGCELLTEPQTSNREPRTGKGEGR